MEARRLLAALRRRFTLVWDSPVPGELYQLLRFTLAPLPPAAEVTAPPGDPPPVTP